MVNIKEILRLAMEFMRFESDASHREQREACLDTARRFFSDWAFVSEFDIGGVRSLVATTRPTKTPTLLLHGHLDVVPAKQELFEPSVHGDLLVGRGALDMKGACAVLLHVFEACRTHDLGVMLTGDEEVGGQNGAKALIEMGYRPAFVLSAEPTDLRIGNEAKGALVLRIHASGRQAHSAYPWQGDNAAHTLVRALAEVTKTFSGGKIMREECWETSFSCNQIIAGTAFNVIPAAADATLDIRYIPQEDPLDIVERVRLAAGDGVEVSIERLEPPAWTDPSHEFVRALVSELGDKKDVFLQKHGGSDVRHFNAAGIAGVVFGPNGSGMHGDGEQVSIASLERLYNLLCVFAARIS